MILAGTAASPVSVMKRLLTSSAMISRMRGPRDGRGLVAVRSAGIDRLYGVDASLDLVSEPGLGTVARINLPWR